MADIKITDLVDEKVFEDLEKLSENLKSVKQQYIDAAKELAQGLNMKITTSGDLEKLNNAVAESSKKAQQATEQLNTTIDRQREIIGQTTNTISRELAEIEKANKAKRDAFAQDKSALEIAESIIGTRNGNIRLLAQYQAELKAVKEAQKNLDTAIKSGTVSEGAAAKQMAANLEKQRTLKASIQDLNNVLNNQDKQMQAANGSYQKLSLQLEFLKKAYKSLNEEEKSSAIGQKLADEISNMDAHLKDLAADMGEFQRNTGNYAIANQSVKKELRELIQEIATLTLQYRTMSDEEKGSAAGQELEAKMNALKARASELKDAVSDVNREIQSGANDTQTFSAITEGINVVISGVGGLTAASHALGIGEKDLIKIQTSLQASLAASNALVRAQTALQAESNLMKGVARIQEAAHATAIKIKTAAEGESIVVTKAATVAQAAFNAVAKANPYVLLATGIGLLVAAVITFTKRTKEETEEQKKAREEMEKSRQEYEDFIDVEKRLADAREEGIKSCSDEITKLDLLYNIATNLNRSYAAREIAVKKLQEQYPSYFQNLEKEAIMAGEAENKYNSLKDSIIKTALAKAKIEEIEELARKHRESEKEMNDASEKLNKIMQNLGYSTTKILDKSGKEIEIYVKNAQTQMDKLWQDRPESERKKSDFNLKEKERLEQVIKEAKQNQEDYLKAMNEIQQTIEDNDLIHLFDNVVKTNSTDTNSAKETTTKTYEEIKEVILEYTQEIIAERIALTEKGSKEEYDLTLQYITAEQELRKIEIEKGYKSEKKSLDEALANKTVSQEEYNASIEQLEQARNEKSILAEKKADKAKEEARLKYTEAAIKAVQEEYAKEEEIRNLNLIKELTALTKQRSKKMLSEEDYQKRVAETQLRFAEQTANKQIEMLEKVLQMEDLTADQRNEITEQLKAAKIKAANDAANAELKNIKEIEKQDKDSKKKREQLIKQFLRTVSRTIGQLNSLVSAMYEGQIQEVEKEQEASEQAYEKEVERIQNLEETGAISKEEAEARKRAAEQRSAEKQEELEKKKQELQYKQAVWNKVTSIAQAGIATALAITEALPNFVLAALVGAMGAMEIATIIATPIATYAKGTGKDGHPGGLAIVGDAGKSEAVVYGNKLWITPDTPTLVDMPKGAIVYPDADKIPEPVIMTMTPTSDSKNPVVIVHHDSKKLERGLAQTNALLKKSIIMQKNIAYDAAYQNYKKTRL